MNCIAVTDTVPSTLTRPEEPAKIACTPVHGTDWFNWRVSQLVEVTSSAQVPAPPVMVRSGSGAVVVPFQ